MKTSDFSYNEMVVFGHKGKKHMLGSAPEGANNGRRRVREPCQNKPDDQQGIIDVQEIQDAICYNNPRH